MIATVSAGKILASLEPVKAPPVPPPIITTLNCFKMPPEVF